MLGIVQCARDARFRELQAGKGVGGVGPDGLSLDLALVRVSDGEEGLGVDDDGNEGLNNEKDHLSDQRGNEKGGSGMAAGGSVQERVDGSRRVIEVVGSDKKGGRKGALGVITEEGEEGEGTMSTSIVDIIPPPSEGGGNEEGGHRGESMNLEVDTTENSAKSGILEPPHFSESSPKSGVRPHSAMPVVMSGPYHQRSVPVTAGEEGQRITSQRIGLMIDTSSSLPLSSSQPLSSSGSDNIRTYLKPPMSGGPPQPSLPRGTVTLLSHTPILPHNTPLLSLIELPY